MPAAVLSFADNAESARPEARRPSPLRVLLAAPRGFCAGVERAIHAVEDALRLHGAPVYVRRPIVHNLTVVRNLEAKGAIFVQELDEVPEGSVVLFSAHGVSPAIAADAKRRSLKAFDAVCPLVFKVHREVIRHHRHGRHVILIGHQGHPEVEGTIGQVPRGAISIVNSASDVAKLGLARSTPVAYAVQTTYSVGEAATVIDAILSGFDDVTAPARSDICYATTNRQTALGAIASEADALIVAGASFSSNANRLVDLARAAGCNSVQLVGETADIHWRMLDGARTLGLTAAASTPESTVQAILEALSARFTVSVEERTHSTENIVFRPLGLA